ncbi:GNAT family N-acetyltransferase [Phaeobacter sp. J2-8]|uniref:GNAT family N-acetyltransferase n=1 Tax=Phaeobacter sp. J2-8 TaxID=2931394 RepID=UPI001FD1B1BC|nr:GNAT family N-acetyltransferase [Phaeobacter sp. J2-8]MCJ7871263.1 GNAT family N-acetyltransferase [Phaeobacter sp. J2-8]
MTPEAMAALHAACFPNRPWSAAEFAQLTEARGMIWLTSPDNDGLMFVQSIPPEAEILTIAVAPHAQRKGVARSLIADMCDRLLSAGVTTLFLEVAEDNTAARGLYANAGFAESGRRKAYYPRAEQPAADAVILRKSLA